MQNPFSMLRLGDMAKGKKKESGKASSAKQLGGDPNLPSKDGPYVSNNGGLYFVGCIWGLVLLAVIGQYIAGS